MKKILLLLISSNLLAVTSNFTGEGRVSKAPEYATFTVTIQSQCFEKPQDAKNSNHEAVEAIQTHLKRYMRQGQPLDAIYTNGGSVKRYIRSWYDEESREHKYECRNSWQKTTVLTIKTSDMKKFSENFGDITEYVTGNFFGSEMGKRKDKEAITFVEISEASPHLTDRSFQALEIEAYKLAVQHAKAKNRACAEEFTLDGQWEVVNYGDSAPVYRSNSQEFRAGPRGPEGVAGLEGARGPTGPTIDINFEDIWVSASVNVEFSFSRVYDSGSDSD
jgi:uncharacterized protein YggE